MRIRRLIKQYSMIELHFAKRTIMIGRPNGRNLRNLILMRRILTVRRGRSRDDDLCELGDELLAGPGVVIRFESPKWDARVG